MLVLLIAIVCEVIFIEIIWNYRVEAFDLKFFFFVINSQGKWGGTLILDNIISRGQNL